MKNQENKIIFRNPKLDYSLIDFCTKTKVVGMPAGSIFKMLDSMAKDVNVPRPMTLKTRIQARDNYFQIASILN